MVSTELFYSIHAGVFCILSDSDITNEQSGTTVERDSTLNLENFPTCPHFPIEALIQKQYITVQRKT